MAQVNTSIAGRQFRLACEDGQEDHLQALAKDIDQRIIDLRRKFGEIGDTRLTVMAALMLADELVVSANTVKAQLGSLYRKLNVHSREQALSEAVRLHVL